MNRPQYRHAVAEHSVRASRAAAFEVSCDLDFLAPEGLTRTVQSDEAPWRRIWLLDGPTWRRYTALSVHVIAGPDVVDPSADDIDLLLVTSLTSEKGDDDLEQPIIFSGLAQRTELFATTWAERLR